MLNSLNFNNSDIGEGSDSAIRIMDFGTAAAVGAHSFIQCAIGLVYAPMDAC